MLKRILNFFFCFMILTSCPSVFAQEKAVNKRPAPKTIVPGSLLKIHVEAQKRNSANNGTDVSNVFRFTITDVSLNPLNQEYVLVWLSDGHEREQINTITFPFTFERNFKGFENGQYTITINIEEKGTYHLLAQDSVVINVVH